MPDRRKLLALLGLPLLFLSDPRLWHGNHALWLAPVGLGLALTAWVGLWAAGLVALAALLAGLAGGGTDWPVLTVIEAVVLGGVVGLGWWCYHFKAKGVRRLNDPRSATLFLILVPGAVAGLAAVLLALAGQALGPGLDDVPTLAVAWWIRQVLGILTLAPPLLVIATPWLVRRGLALPESGENSPWLEPATQLGWGESVEAGGLALGAALVGVVLGVQHARTSALNWSLWGLLLLLIVWTSLRQGLPGGSLAAALSAILALETASFLPPRVGAQLVPLQGNLLAQCTTALLVGASAGWIRASEARYRQFVGHMPVVLYSARLLSRPGGHRIPQAEVTLVSPASRHILGCAPEELLGDYALWLERVHPADRELLAAALTQLTLQREPVTCEYRVLSVDGGWWVVDGEKAEAPPASPSTTHHPPSTPRERWVRDTLAPHYGPDGRLEGWEGVVEDITERRQLASELRRTGNMLQALVTHLPTGVFFVHGPTGQPLFVNARARQLLGRREDLAAGVAHLSRVYRLHRPDGTLYPVEELPVSKALDAGITSMRDDIVVHRPDGRRVPLITWAAPVELGGQGQPDGAVWVLEDLTALRQAEAAQRRAADVLRLSEEKYRGLVENLPLMVLQLDCAGRVTYLNPAAVTATGHGLDGLRAAGSWESLICPEDLPGVRALFAEALAGRSARGEFRYKSRDGSEKVGYGLVQPSAPPGGNEPGATFLVVDVTQQRRLEQELQRVVRLELIGRLASGIVHDVNNLLTVILSLAELAQMNLLPEHPARADLQRIVQAGEQATQLIAQLLAFSKERRIAARRVDVNAVVRRNLELLAASLPANIVVESILAPGEVGALADESQLQQVLMNLCLNARDAMPEGGRLTVRTALEATGSNNSDPAGGWVRLTVQDTGHGMSEEVRSRIFDVFFTTKERGSGLGLAVSKQIVDSFRGRIDLWSEPGKGTRFEVWLPAAPLAGSGVVVG
ncbi:MAG TPA: PAS domain S-box protein [Gemmataceae bacterium]|nr:PAS domain S-box protein [Gemmataceae bacterium]